MFVTIKFFELSFNWTMAGNIQGFQRLAGMLRSWLNYNIKSLQYRLRLLELILSVRKLKLVFFITTYIWVDLTSMIMGRCFHLVTLKQREIF